MNIKSLKQLDRSNLGEYAKEQIHRAFSNKTTNPTTNLEQPVVNKQVGKKKNARFNKPVCIDILSTRKRQTDNRAISEKALVDALVKTGILKNDTKNEIIELNVYEPTISSEESTIVIISELINK